MTTASTWNTRGRERRCHHPAPGSKFDKRPRPHFAWACGQCRIKLIEQIQADALDSTRTTLDQLEVL